MSQYQAPVSDMNFVLFDVFKVHEYWQANETLAPLIDNDTAMAILEEGAKITTSSIAPHSRESDELGVSFKDGVVTTPACYKNAYQVIAEGGWIGLCGAAQYGGMAMPKVISVMFDEMLCSADLSFSLYTSLTSAAALTIARHATDELKSNYLEKLYSGEWAGTMCLTESHAGTDLGIMHTKATPNADGSYNITGTKIFITAGEHDLTENIVHLVLAKLPDAPAGTKGISLFLVPKFTLDAEGNIGERNTLVCGSIEEKMGIHGSPTCVMNFDGATGYIIGEPHRGLACMFTMMNYERLSMGSQGMGCAERSYQNALAYAKDRLQGKGTEYTGEKVADPIIVHADVRRMLLNMKCLIEAGRAFNTYVAIILDQSEFEQDPVDKAKSAAKAALLTPIAKAFVTDIGLELCVAGQQVFGGHGFIREWGQEQLVRDVRISQIYEGTNGIQALDLLGRKVAGDGGATMYQVFDEIQACIAEFDEEHAARSYAQQLLGCLVQARELTDTILLRAKHNPNEIGAASVEYLHIIGYVLYGYMWLKILAAAAHQAPAFYQQRLHTAAYYFKRILVRTDSLYASVSAGAECLYAHGVDDF